MNNPRYIIMHHSLTADGTTVSWGAIRDYHIKERGWNDIGYHFGIELVGDTYEVLVGRMPDVVGAHTKELGMYSSSIGICMVGNFDLAPPNANQLGLARQLVKWCMRNWSISAHSVLAHREVGVMAGFDWRKGQYKSCCGAMFDMDAFRASVE